MNEIEWITIDRPGFSGRKRDNKHLQLNNKYGKDNWRTAWQWGDQIIKRDLAYQLYEDAYFCDSFINETIWKELVSTAKNVYDYNPIDVKSGLDYSIQNGPANHLQDISIRRVVKRRGWEFSGDELIQIRSQSQYWGNKLSPGRVSFHYPEQIVTPHLKSWWNNDSIEDFYQSNKVLQVKR
jgi:hypothetical protein